MKINDVLAKCKNWHIVVVGCGGTGSNLVPHLSQLAYSLKGETITIDLVDEDLVEKDNVGRQFFASPDVGQNKARVLHLRYQKAWGVKLGYCPHYIREEAFLERLLTPPEEHSGAPAMPILVGCVDNHFSRRIMNNVFQKAENLIYLDAGNSEFAGQAVVAMRYKGKTLLKSPVEYFPDILTEKDEISTGGTCGRKAVKVPQSLIANLWAATLLLSYLNSIIGLKDLPSYMATFNSRNCVMRPEYII